jgi:DNA-binding transcriptional regulator YiaG
MSWQKQHQMTGLQFRQILRRLDISRAGASRWLGVSEATAERWSHDKARIPAAVAMLLRAMVELEIAPMVPNWERDR